MKLWVVGHVLNDDGTEWTFCGVFDTEAKAVAACKNEDYFVGLAELNQELPEKIIDWPDAYYPKAEKGS